MFDTERTLSERGLARCGARVFPKGTILYAMYASVGECSIAAVPVATSQAILGIETRDSLDGTYLYHVLSHMKAQIRFSGQQGTQNNLNMKMVKELLIPLPQIEEQRRIATVLTDSDEMIESLQRLIAKKRYLMHGVRRQLLSRETRLPGYSGEWGVQTINELFSFLRTVALSRDQLTCDGEVGYIHYGDIHTKWDDHLDLSRHEVPMAGYELVGRATEVQDGDLVIADASEDVEGVGKSVEIQGAHGRRVVAGLHTILLRPRIPVFAAGFAGLLQHTPAFRHQAARLAAGLKVYGISKSALATFQVSMPSVAEQRAIAEVIMDMDAEIEALERRLAKTRDLKQGMAQELLTGRTRLV